MTQAERQRLKTAVQLLAGTHLWDKNGYLFCTVDSVDEVGQVCDCTPIGGDATTQIPAVKLTSEKNDGLLIIPVVGSTVAVMLSQKSEPFVALFSDINKFILIASTLIQFNGGEFGGLVKVVELTQKINALENLVNELIVKYNTHVHPGVTVGAGSTLVTATQEAGSIAPITQKADIENTSITHGQ